MVMSKIPIRQYTLPPSLLVSRPETLDMCTATRIVDSALCFSILTDARDFGHPSAEAGEVLSPHPVGIVEYNADRLNEFLMHQAAALPSALVESSVFCVPILEKHKAHHELLIPLEHGVDGSADLDAARLVNAARVDPGVP